MEAPINNQHLYRYYYAGADLPHVTITSLHNKAPVVTKMLLTVNYGHKQQQVH